MGLLRAICSIAIIISALVGYRLYSSGVSIWTLVPLMVGVAALLAVVPFVANTRPRRTRVMNACLVFAVGGGVSSVLAIASHLTATSVLSAVFPLFGLALSGWAYRTRGRYRVARYANYYQE